MKYTDYIGKKVWIGNNPKLLKKVLNEILPKFNLHEVQSIGCHLNNNPSCLFIRENNEIGACSQTYTKQEFDNSSFTEVLPGEFFGEMTYEIY